MPGAAKARHSLTPLQPQSSSYQADMGCQQPTLTAAQQATGEPEVAHTARRAATKTAAAATKTAAAVCKAVATPSTAGG